MIGWKSVSDILNRHNNNRLNNIKYIKSLSPHYNMQPRQQFPQQQPSMNM